MFLPVLGIPSSISVKDIEALASIQIVDGAFVIDQEGMFAQFGVDGTPPDVVGGGGLVDDTLVLGRATRLLARAGDECAGGGDDGPSFVAEGVLVEFSNGGIAVHFDVVVVNPRVVVEHVWVWVVNPVVGARVGLLWVVVGHCLVVFLEVLVGVVPWLFRYQGK